jgi:hypothetical protein
MEVALDSSMLGGPIRRRVERGLPAFILGAHCVGFLALEAADFARGNELGPSDALSAAGPAA